MKAIKVDTGEEVELASITEWVFYVIRCFWFLLSSMSLSIFS